MNKSIVFHYLSKAMIIGAALLLAPAAVSLYYSETETALTFLLVAVCVALLFTPLAVLKPKNKQIYAREGLVIVALMWILYPAVGALPFYISGEIPHFVDALFESVSGFTTTGSSILSDVEALSRGMLFWRSFTHWIGGMGVLVLVIAILPSSSNALPLMQAECSGPKVGKIVPKGKLSAVYLYIIYGFITAVTIILLLIGDMPLYDSVCHAFGVVGTGGFSIKNTGIAFYNSAYIEGVLTGAVLACGINFSLYYYLLIRRFKEVFKNTELRVYLGIVAVATTLIAVNIYPIYESAGKSFRYAIFEVATILTSTGFTLQDFCAWPVFSQTLITVMMFIGACAGSTGGGIKVQRVVVMFKSAGKSINKILHPKSVNVVKSEEKAMDVKVVHGIHNYLIIYVFLWFISLLLVSLNNIGFQENFSAVTSCFNNIGPGLGQIGPTSNFGLFSDLSKSVLMVDMLLGRLEIFPILILFSPSVWRKSI